MKTIYLAGGCFWGLEKYISSIPGVISTSVGYANGRTENPTYKEVCFMGTGHAETVKVNYDETKISLGFLLEAFFGAIDPTTLNRQGNDTGEQYRSGIYYTDGEDAAAITDALDRLREELGEDVATECLPLSGYYEAEEYHQKYLDKNPSGYCHIGPDLIEKARSHRDPSI
jgi:peptide methionine sulfoxide reductase msrA/msrB